MRQLSKTLVVASVALLHLAAVSADDKQPAAKARRDSHQPLIAKIRPAITTIRVQGRDGDEIGIGTGFIVDAEGLVATNFHVINEGRPFTIETTAGDSLRVLSVEASDVASDLVLIRIDPANQKLTALDFAAADSSEQGMRVLAFGNPLGLKDSVVEGIVSAKREVEGRPMLQLAMPIEPGNSGGPVVDMQGRVHGIVNMKSAIDDNLGFAIPIDQLASLKDNPNPVAIDRWVRLGRINEDHWTPLFGATWQQRGGRITASGTGRGFGGRALCLSTSELPKLPLEIAVMVRLDDESGAAGLAFHSDAEHRHYGFYPSAGRLRLTCFRGPTVYSWQVLQEVDSEHYLPGQWNHLKVRIEKDRLKCFVNGQLVIESSDTQLSGGRVGLAKFRDTKPEFKRFQVGKNLPSESLSESAATWLAGLEVPAIAVDSIGSEQVDDLGKSGDLASRELVRQALALEKQAKQLRQLADDVRRAATVARLRELSKSDADDQLLRGALLIALLDNPDIDIDVYEQRIDQMAEEIRSQLDKNASATDKRDAMHRYLFKDNGFHGSRSEYYHRANSHLNRVIDDREGLPITMSILYMELGRRLGLNIVGVGLPGHFIVKQIVDKDHQQLIDVFERGKLLDRSDASSIVAMHSRQPFDEEYLRPQTNIEILTRVLNNLIGLAGRTNDGEAMLRYCDAMVALNPEITRFRLMRAQLRGMTGRIATAMEDLDWLLEKNPSDLDRELAEHMRAHSSPDASENARQQLAREAEFTVAVLGQIPEKRFRRTFDGNSDGVDRQMTCPVASQNVINNRALRNDQTGGRLSVRQ